MQAIILAAGMGNRLGSITDELPKSLVRVAGRELILRVMDFLDNPAITERVVVTGFESEKLEGFLVNNVPGVKTVFNPNFRDGSIRTIETALPCIRGDFLLMNADHIYPRRMLGHILKHRRGLQAICDFDRTLSHDDMKVKLTPNKKLARIRKTLDDFDCGYIGMTACDESSLKTYAQAVTDARREHGDGAAVETVLGQLAGDRHTIEICDASGMAWLEVDTPEDLAHAERTLNDNPGFLS